MDTDRFNPERCPHGALPWEFCSQCFSFNPVPIAFATAPRWRSPEQQRWYASWDAYDAVARSPLDQAAQAKAEVFELYRMLRL